MNLETSFAESLQKKKRARREQDTPSSFYTHSPTCLSSAAFIVDYFIQLELKTCLSFSTNLLTHKYLQLFLFKNLRKHSLSPSLPKASSSVQTKNRAQEKIYSVFKEIIF